MRRYTDEEVFGEAPLDPAAPVEPVAVVPPAGMSARKIRTDEDVFGAPAPLTEGEMTLRERMARLGEQFKAAASNIPLAWKSASYGLDVAAADALLSPGEALRGKAGTMLPAGAGAPAIGGVGDIDTSGNPLIPLAPGELVGGGGGGARLAPDILRTESETAPGRLFGPMSDVVAAGQRGAEALRDTGLTKIAEADAARQEIPSRTVTTLDVPGIGPIDIKDAGYYAAQGFEGVIGSMMPAILAGALIPGGGVPLATATMFGQVASDEYGRDRVKGAKPGGLAAEKAIVGGLAEAIPETVPFAFFLKEGGPLLRRLAAGVLSESGSEMLTEALRIGYETGRLGEDISLREAVQRIGDAGLVGLTMGAGGAAVGAAADRVKAKKPPPEPEPRPGAVSRETLDAGNADIARQRDEALLRRMESAHAELSKAPAGTPDAAAAERILERIAELRANLGEPGADVQELDAEEIVAAPPPAGRTDPATGRNPLLAESVALQDEVERARQRPAPYPAATGIDVTETPLPVEAIEAAAPPAPAARPAAPLPLPDVEEGEAIEAAPAPRDLTITPSESGKWITVTGALDAYEAPLKALGGIKTKAGIRLPAAKASAVEALMPPPVTDQAPAAAPLALPAPAPAPAATPAAEPSPADAQIATLNQRLTGAGFGPMTAEQEDVLRAGGEEAAGMLEDWNERLGIETGDVAPPATGTTLAPAGRMFFTIAGRRYPVESVEDAAAKWDSVRDTLMKQGFGRRDLGDGGEVVDETGTPVARISWNGRMWRPDGSEIVPPGKKAAEEAVAESRNRQYDKDGNEVRVIEGQAAPAPEAATPAVAAPAAPNRAATAKARYEAEKRIKPAEDDILAAIAKLGGISRESAKYEGIDPTEFKRKGWRILPVFPAKGGLPFDAMAERLAQWNYPVFDGGGYQGDEGPYSGNVLLDAVQEALSGAKIGTPQYVERQADRQAADALDDETAQAEQAALDAEEAEVETALSNAFTDEELDQLVAEREQALNDLRSEAEADARERARATAEDGEGPGAEAPAGAAAGVAPERDRPGAGEEAPLLESYDQAELDARAAAKAADEKKAADEAAAAERKAQADAERGDFLLTGSDRAADVLAARGQGDLLGANPPRRGQTPAAPAEAPTAATPRVITHQRTDYGPVPREWLVETEKAAATLPAGQYVLLEVRQINPEAKPAWSAEVSNGDGTTTTLILPFGDKPTDEQVRAAYSERKAADVLIEEKATAARAERIKEIEAKGIRVGVEWREPRAYVTGRDGMTTFTRATVTKISDDGFITVEAVLRGSARRYVFTTGPNSRLFDNYPTPPVAPAAPAAPVAPAAPAAAPAATEAPAPADPVTAAVGQMAGSVTKLLDAVTEKVSGKAAETPAPEASEGAAPAEPAATDAQDAEAEAPADADTVNINATHAIPLESITTPSGAMKAGAYNSTAASAPWWHQGDLGQLRFNARAKIAGAQPANERVRNKADELDKAVAAGWRPVNMRAGSFGTVWTLQKDGEVLTNAGAAALRSGVFDATATEGDANDRNRDTFLRSRAAFGDFVRWLATLPESTLESIPALNTKIGQTTIGDRFSLYRGSGGEPRLEVKEMRFSLGAPEENRGGRMVQRTDYQSLLVTVVEYAQLPDTHEHWADAVRTAEAKALPMVAEGLTVVDALRAHGLMPKSGTPAADDYEARYKARVARAESAASDAEAEAVLQEEYQDDERHFEGTSAVEDAVKAGKRKRAEAPALAQAAEARARALERGEWVEAPEALSEVWRRAAGRLPNDPARVAFDEAMERARAENPQFEYRTGVRKMGDVELNVVEMRKRPATQETAEPVGIIAAFDTFFERLRNGEASLKEYREQYARIRDSEAEIRELLAAKTKADLLAMMGVGGQARYRNDKKAKVVDGVYDVMVSTFGIGRGLTYMMGGKNAQRDARDKQVESTTEADLKKYADDVAKRREEMSARVKGFKNPQTLEDFDLVVRINGEGSLTPEQAARYDDLLAAAGRERRKAAQERAAVVQGADAGTAMTLTETVHTRDGYPLFVVKLADRVDRAVYDRLNQAAKRLGGWYSSYSKGGAVPGFQFKARESAEQFMAVGRGETVAVTDRVEAKKETRRDRAVAKLREMADRMEGAGNEEMGRERLTNTSKRAAQAGYAEERARREVAFARTMRNLANAIEAGNAPNLEGVTQRVQLEMLESMLAQAKYDRLRKEFPAYIDQERNKGRAATPEDAVEARWPEVKAPADHIFGVVRALQGVNGTKRLRDRLTAIAEKAKRGDQDRQELVPWDDVLETLEKVDGKRLPWYWPEYAAKRKRLLAMGIEDLPMLRAALRELAMFQGDAPKENRAQALERALVGQKVGIDFFPTPKETAADLVGRAGVEPGMAVLEPSAGNGNIAEAIRAAGAEPDVAEVSSQLREVLEAKGFNLVARDFMDMNERDYTFGDVFRAPDGTVGVMRGAGGMGSGRVRLVPDDGGERVASYHNRDELEPVEKRGSGSGYDRIIMNPPFSNNMDIEHVRRAYDLLRPGGKLVAIMGEGAFFRQGKTETGFRAWLDRVGGTNEPLSAGTFTDKTLLATTGANARIVEIEKPTDTDRGVGLSARGNIDPSPWRMESEETSDGPVYFGPDLILMPDGHLARARFRWNVLDRATNKLIGTLVMAMDGGRFTALHDIRVVERSALDENGRPKVDAQGNPVMERAPEARLFGRRVLRALTATNDGEPFAIRDIVEDEDTRAFYERIGAYDYSEAGRHAVIDWQAYAATDREVTAGLDARGDGGLRRERPGQDRSVPRAQSAPAGEVRQGLTVAEAREHIRRLFGKKVASADWLHVVPDATGVPPGLRAGGQNAVTDPREGPTKGHVWLIASRMTADNAFYTGIEGLALHEGLHAGLEGMLGAKRYREVIDWMRAALASTDPNDRSARAVAEARALVPNDTAEQHVDEETLAYLVQDARNHDLPMVRRVWHWLRAWAVRFGITRAMSPETLAELARMAIHARTRGTVSSPERFAATPAMRSGPAAPFYSAVAKAVQDAPQGKGIGQQWLAWIKKGADVRQEEIDWMGLPQWLAEQKGTITREQVADFVRANAVEVEVVQRGDARAAEEADAYLQRINDLGYEVQSDDGEVPYLAKDGEPIEELDEQDQPTDPELRRAWNEYLDALAQDRNTRYSQYTLPGGTNYREMLITLPGERSRTWSEARDDVVRKWPGADADSYDGMSAEKRARFDDIYGSEAAFRRRSEKDTTPPNAYRGPHWDEPNILVHLRMNERESVSQGFVVENAKSGNRSEVFATREDAEAYRATLPSASAAATKIVEAPRSVRTLFIEEIQSDWHREGRQKGYTSTEAEQERKRLQEQRRDVLRRVSRVFPDAERIERGSEYSVINRWARNPTYAPTPDGPDGTGGVVTDDHRELLAQAEIDLLRINQQLESVPGPSGVPDAPFKKSWPMLAMKHAIRYAAENGFDQVAWITGEQTQARYDLSKRISELRVERIGGPGEALYVLTAKRHDGPMADLGAHAAEKLPDVIGKEMAEKITATKEKVQIYRGLDLKTGGEWAVNLYDKVLPAEVQKYVKKWGAKVGRTGIAAGRKMNVARQQDGTIEWQILGDKNQILEVHRNEADARASIAAGASVHALDITPAMRESVRQGQPLFARSGGEIVGDAVAFAKAVDDFLAKKIEAGAAIDVTRTPDILEALGVRDGSIRISQRIMAKTLTGKHGGEVTVNGLKSLVRNLHSPIAVLDSATEPGALVVLTQIEGAETKRPVVAMVHIARRDEAQIHWIKTIHERDVSSLLKSVREGRLRYFDESLAPRWWRTGGFDTAAKATPAGAQRKILSPEDVRKFMQDRQGGVSAKGPEAPRGRWGRPQRNPQTPFHAENARLREEDRTLWSKAKQELVRQLAPGGLLPADVFKEKIGRDNQLQVVEFDIHHLVGGLERAIKADYGKPAVELTDAEMRRLSRALGGNMDASLPVGTRKALLAMRAYIDSLSAEYVDMLDRETDRLLETAGTDAGVSARALRAAMMAAEEGEEVLAARRLLVSAYENAGMAAQAANRAAFADTGALAEALQRASLMQTIANNIGEYVHRSYRAFDDPQWFEKIPDATLNAARAYLVERYVEEGESEARAARMAEATLHEIVKTGTAYESMEAFIKESKLGAKDLSVLKRRKAIAPEIRALLGEHVDPRLNFAKSATKMGRLIWNQRFLDKVLEIGRGVFLFAGQDRPAAATVKIAADASEPYAPLNGLWTFPEINQAFVDALGKEQMGDLYRTIVQLNGLVKFGKTVLSPTTAARNWQSAMFFALANGHFNLGHAAKSVAGLREYFTAQGRGAQLAYLRKLKELGVVYDVPYADEMMRLLSDSRVEDLLRGRAGKGVEAARDGLDFAKRFYSYGDDFWKIIGWENEKAALRRAGMTEAKAEVEAAERIRNTYPTYSMVGKGIRSLARFPLAGTFVSFPAEIVRTTSHILRYIAKDWKNPATRPLALRRAAGLAMTTAAFYGLQALSMAMLGMDDDEEEAVRLLAAPWSKNAHFLFTGRDEQGRLQYFDLSFLDPYSYFKKPITAIFRDQPWDQSLASALGELLLPFFGVDIMAGAIGEAIANKKASGGPVYGEHDDVVKQTVDIANHLRRAAQPGVLSNLERTLKAIRGEKSPSGMQYRLTDEGWALLGWRSTTVDPRVALYYRAFEFSDAKRAAMKRLTTVLRDPNDVDDGDLAIARRAAERQHAEAFREMGLVVRAARRSGMAQADIAGLLTASGVSRADTVALLQGATPPLRLVAQSAKGAGRRAEALFGPETARTIMDRYRTSQATPPSSPAAPADDRQ